MGWRQDVCIKAYKLAAKRAILSSLSVYTLAKSSRKKKRRGQSIFFIFFYFTVRSPLSLAFLFCLAAQAATLSCWDLPNERTSDFFESEKWIKRSFYLFSRETSTWKLIGSVVQYREDLVLFFFIEQPLRYAKSRHSLSLPLDIRFQSRRQIFQELSQAQRNKTKKSIYSNHPILFRQAVRLLLRAAYSEANWTMSVRKKKENIPEGWFARRTGRATSFKIHIRKKKEGKKTVQKLM